MISDDGGVIGVISSLALGDGVMMLSRPKHC